MSSTYRVVYLDHTAVESGAELALLRLLPAMEHVEPWVILGSDGPLVMRLQEAGVRVEVLPLRSRTAELRKERSARFSAISVLDTLVYSLVLAKRLRQLRASIVHTNSLKANVYGALAARLAGVPQVWHARDLIATPYLPMPAVRWVRALARRAPAAIIANSHATADSLPQSGRRHVVPSVSHDPYASAEAVERNYAAKDCRFVMVGRLAPWKGQDLVIQAFAAAFPDGGHRLDFVGSAMFGEDAYHARLGGLIRSLGLLDRVRLLGFQRDVSRILEGADALVHYSVTPEPFGQVIVEGMAAGLPVIASDEGGPSEIITHRVDGLLVRPRDVRALASELRLLADATETRASLGRSARISSARYAPAAIAEQVEAVYEEVLMRKQSRRGARLSDD